MILGSALLQPWTEPDAYQQVVRAFDWRVDASAELMVVRTFPDTGAKWHYNMVTTTKNGGQILLEFTNPSHMQRVKVLVDGKQLKQYSPSSKSILTADSPFLNEPTNAQRLSLIKRNYVAKYERETVVAGVRGYEIKLNPVSPDLYSRKIVVAKDSLYLLQHDIWLKGKESDSDTIFQVVSFNSLDSAPTLKFATNRGTVLDDSAAPQVLKDPALGAALIGFSPPTLGSPPYGLVENVRQIPQSDTTYRPLRISMTDGIATLNAWLWIAKGRGGSSTLPSPNGDLKPMYYKGSIGCMVEGDFPVEARRQIALSYLKAIGSPERD